jgi:predicted outer membrane repeat protein
MPIAENTEIRQWSDHPMAGTRPLFQVLTDKTLSLRDITLREGNGTVTSGFGAIQNFGTLNLTNSQLISNTSPAFGGAIDNRGGLNLTNSVVAENTAGQSGGGIYNEGR